MPKKADFVTVPEQRMGLAAMGKALRSNWRKIDGRSITKMLQSLKTYEREVSAPIARAGREAVFDQAEKRARLVSVHSRLGAPAIAFSILCEVILCDESIRGREQFATDIWHQQDKEDRKRRMSEGEFREFKRGLATPPDDAALGQRLRDAVVLCQNSVQSVRTATLPTEEMFPRLAEACLDKIIDELARNGILKLCKSCNQPFFPSRLLKQRCSVDYEGKNCAGNARTANSRRPPTQNASQ